MYLSGLQHFNLIFSHIFSKICENYGKIGNFQLKWWNMIVEVYQKVWNLCMSKFNTMSRALSQSSCTIWWRHSKFNKADGRHFENRYISVYQPRIVRISRNLVCRCIFWPRLRKREKNSEIVKFKMADGRHTENNFLAIIRLHIVRLRRNLEFRGIIAHIQRFGDQNVKFRKCNTADGHHFENCYISISQPRIVRIWWNLVCRRKFWPRWRKRDKNWEIAKFKMADRRHIENHFWL